MALGSTDAQVLDSASAHLDSALAINTKTSTQATFIRQATEILKARVLIDQGKFSSAPAVIADVPSSYAYYMATSQAKGTSLGMWSIVNSTARLSVSDSFEIVNGTPTPTKNALPFASAKDPRVPVTFGGSASPPVVAEDGSTPQFIESLYGRFDPIAMVSGIDARLIEAEAKLNASDIAGMMTILNALRAAPPKIANYQPTAMAALPAPATQDSAVTLFFREKAFWTFGRGQRLNDDRRQMRQYKRTEDQVFPTGAYFKGGSVRPHDSVRGDQYGAHEPAVQGVHRPKSLISPKYAKAPRDELSRGAFCAASSSRSERRMRGDCSSLAFARS